MGNWDGQERRKKKRFGIRGCTVRYRRGGLLGLLSPGSDRFLTLNVSETGLHFISRDAIAEGYRVAVTLEAPQLGDTIHAKGIVIWCRKSTEHDAHHVGVEFTGLSKGNRIRLKVLLDNAVLEKIDLTTKVYLKEIEKL